MKRSASFLKERAATLSAIADAAAFLFLTRPIDISGKAAKAIETDEAKRLTAAAAKALARADWSTPATLDEELKALAETAGVGFGKIGQPLRAALTAGLPSPSLGKSSTRSAGRNPLADSATQYKRKNNGLR